MIYKFEISFRDSVTVEIEADDIHEAWDIVENDYNDSKWDYEISRIV